MMFFIISSMAKRFLWTIILILYMAIIKDAWNVM